MTIMLKSKIEVIKGEFDSTIEKLSEIKTAMGTDKTRKMRASILAYLEQAGEEGMTVTEIQVKVRCEEQPIISRYLKQFRDLSLVSFKRDGKYVRYKRTKVQVKDLVHSI